MQFSHIVSLGWRCRPTYQAQRYFNFGLSFPFDWWVSTVEGLTAALDTSYDPYQMDLLQEVKNDNGIFQIANQDRSIGFHHEFPREHREVGSPVVKNWRDFVGNNRDTFVKRRDRLLGLNTIENNILFLRQSRGNEPGFQRLFDKLSTDFNLAQFSVLLLNEKANIPHHASVLRVDMNDTDGDAPEIWKGQDSEWDTLFSKLEIRLSNDCLPAFRGVRMNE
jgi:hypothetical protein